MGCRVLFVSDDPEMGMLVDLILTRGRKDIVTWTPPSHQALIDSGQDPPELIIVEFTIPEVGGFAVYEQLKTIPALQNVPVLFWRVPTGKISERAAQMGVMGCIQMPSAPEELLSARDSVLAGGTYFVPG